MTGDKITLANSERSIAMSKSFPLGMKNTNTNPGGRVFGEGPQSPKPGSIGHSGKVKLESKVQPKGK